MGPRPVDERVPAIDAGGTGLAVAPVGAGDRIVTRRSCATPATPTPTESSWRSPAPGRHRPARRTPDPAW